MAKPSLVTVLRQPFTCPVCGGREFYDRQIKLNTDTAEFFDLGWADS